MPLRLSDRSAYDAPFGGELPGSFDGNDSQLLTGCVVEEAHRGDPDLVVDPQLSECDGLLLLYMKNG